MHKGNIKWRMKHTGKIYNYKTTKHNSI